MQDPLLCSIVEIQNLLGSGAVSCRELVELSLKKIDEIDVHGPALQAVLEMNPEALEIAREMDRELRKSGASREGGSALPADKPLFGIPVMLKGNIDTGDGMDTTAGSLALAGHRAAEDAPLVRKLRSAGAIILGKTNLSEWANFRSTRSVSGWSSLGGQTRNPHVLDRNPCGSSSGSAVAVAAGLCSVAVGTETDGSIICPSSVNGIVGIKPTLGRVSSRGIIPISSSQDCAGPLARTVEDAAILLHAMADQPLAKGGGDKHSWRKDQSGSPQEKTLQGIRIGVVENSTGKDRDVDAIFENALKALRSAGAELLPAPLPSSSEYEETEMEVLLHEFKAGLNEYLAGCNAPSGVRSLEELINYNNEHRDRVMPHFGQELLIQAASRSSLEDPVYLKALKHARTLTREKGIDEAMDRLKLHALTAPSGGGAWKTDWINGDHFRIGNSSCAAVSGYPSITVPAGFIRELLPVGISFFGRPWSEGELIRIALAFEGSTRCRRDPRFVPSLEMPW